MVSKPAPHRLKRKPEACPACTHRPVASILYGLPGDIETLSAHIQTGRVILGGCDVSLDDPVWQCVACGWQGWKDLGEEASTEPP